MNFVNFSLHHLFGMVQRPSQSHAQQREGQLISSVLLTTWPQPVGKAGRPYYQLR